MPLLVIIKITMVSVFQPSKIPDECDDALSCFILLITTKMFLIFFSANVNFMQVQTQVACKKCIILQAENASRTLLLSPFAYNFTGFIAKYWEYILQQSQLSQLPLKKHFRLNYLIKLIVIIN